MIGSDSRREGYGMPKPMREGDDKKYAIYKHNLKTGEEELICEVLGRDAAGTRAIHYEVSMSEKDRGNGWTFYTKRLES